MDTIHNIEVTVGSVELKEKKTIIKSNDPTRPLKLWFWNLKQDGTATKASTSFIALGVRSGSKVKIGYKETPRSFVDPSGKEVNYTDRQIISIERV